ncbi:MAG: KEOPS complex subunit Cgi121 [Candidatus Heimdallarchaeota archaeon]
MFEIMDHTIVISSAEISSSFTKDSINKLVVDLLAQEKSFKPKSTILFIDSGAIAGIHHLNACILNSLKGIAQKNNISKSLNVEILLYLSGYRQITKAIERCGLSKNTQIIICVQVTNKELFSKSTKNMFNFKEFLFKNSIEIKQFRKDIDSLAISNSQTVMKNLEITEENIDAVIADKKDKTSREQALEYLAIEKSALLNLIK